MSVRTLVLRLAAAAALVVPTLPAQAAPGDVVSVKLALVAFTGYAEITKGRPGRPAQIRGYSTWCSVAGVRYPGAIPFLTVCEFDFTTGNAPLSTACSATWVHISTLTFTVPVVYQPVIVNYEPTTTTVVEGDGGGAGVNATKASKVKYTIDSLCTLSGESDQETANLRGTASGPI